VALEPSPCFSRFRSSRSSRTKCRGVMSGGNSRRRVGSGATGRGRGRRTPHDRGDMRDDRMRCRANLGRSGDPAHHEGPARQRRAALVGATPTVGECYDRKIFVANGGRTVPMVLALWLALAGTTSAQAPPPSSSEEALVLPPVVVTAPPPVSSSSELFIPGKDFELRPQGRPADVLRYVPGLVLGQHAGGGKSEQYISTSCAASTPTTAPTWRCSSTTCRSICDPRPTARGMPTSIS
jgi:hypothetical protein